MQKLPKLSGHEIIKILNKAGFKAIRQKGSHVILVKKEPGKKIGTVVPTHKEVNTGTLKGILKKANISEDQFIELFKSK